MGFYPYVLPVLYSARVLDCYIHIVWMKAMYHACLEFILLNLLLSNSIVHNYIMIKTQKPARDIRMYSVYLDFIYRILRI